jgi:Spy/CpxP family protein refolding chaperone
MLLLLVVMFAATAVLGGIKAECKSKKKDDSICIDMASAMMPGAGLEILIKNPDFQKQLGITDDQMAKIHDIGDKYHIWSAAGDKPAANDASPSNTDLRAKMPVLRKDLDQLVETATDTAKIDAKIDEIAQNTAMIEKNSVHLMVEVNGVLTADQQTKLKQIMRQAVQPRKSEENKGFGGSGGHGPGGGHDGWGGHSGGPGGGWGGTGGNGPWQ